jgi:D-methionine transport system substrate-binding protein
MKKVLLFTALAAALTAGFAQANEKLVVAATPIPHAEILELIKPTLAKEGVDLQIKVFTDYVQPNVQVAEKRLDANYFQTLPYLQNFNKGKGTNLVTVVGVHVEPFGGYSKKIKKIEDLKDGATVAIPNEGSNSGRALLLLQKAGVITLKDPGGTPGQQGQRRYPETVQGADQPRSQSVHREEVQRRGRAGVLIEV